ncbi:unnamed protein product [Anisakis simplex]|uniref:NPH3 domain-containing protein n=1 Tax=Anisakis simplex TaxID=6269 RepID=A0A0M3JEQ6_ANISI|nr:unnamed protein product [Anisakis simplex]
MMTLASVSKIMHQLDESGRLKVPGLKILLDIQLARSKESLPKFGLEKGSRGETILRNRLDNNAPFLPKSSSFPVIPTDGGGDRKAVVTESRRLLKSVFLD